MRPQAQPRFKKRVPCQVAASGRSYSGMVLNVSSGGLFVQTTAAVEPGDHVQIDLTISSEAIPLRAKVVWRRTIPFHLRPVTRGGVGVQIHAAPESYYRFLADVAKPSADDGSEEPAEIPPQPPRFRVRVKQEAGSRSRSIVVLAASDETARERALESAGPGWIILEVERV